MNKKYQVSVKIIIIGLLLDIISKFLVTSNMNLYDSIKIINNFFSITYIYNDGAAWSILKGQMNFFYLITIFALIVMGYLLKTSKSMIQNVAFSLMIAGTLGNFIDRIRLEKVIDFLNFVIFNYDFPVFNVADMCLTIGAIILVFSIIKDGE